jgi:hypothetical protein
MNREQEGHIQNCTLKAEYYKLLSCVTKELNEEIGSRGQVYERFLWDNSEGPLSPNFSYDIIQKTGWLHLPHLLASLTYIGDNHIGEHGEVEVRVNEPMIVGIVKKLVKQNQFGFDSVTFILS